MNLSLICSKFKCSGGMEQYQIDLINGLSQAGIKPIVYSGSFDNKLSEYQLINPIKITLSFIPKIFRNHYLAYIVKKYKKINEISMTTSYASADIVICGGNHKGYIQALKQSQSYIDRIKIRNEQANFTKAKCIIAHSKMMKDEISTLYNIDNNKIKIIYPPINTSKFKTISISERRILRDKFGFKEDEIVYLFPSTGHSRKGFDILKNYFDKSSLPIRLVVAGSPVENSNNISYLGFCKNMPELYQAADFTIMASNYEPFGLVGIESILSGTPLIFAKNIGCLEVLKGDFGFIFDRNNIDSLEEAILNSIERKKQGTSRIDIPLSFLDYDPKLTTHISELLTKIKEFKD